MKKILIVDDCEADCFLITTLVEVVAPEVEVLCASDGQDAMHVLTVDKEHVGLIICDLQMPRMDGLEFLESFKKEGLYIATVIVSGMKQDKDDLLKKKYSFLCEVIEKPLDKSTLSQLLATHLLTQEQCSDVR